MYAPRETAPVHKETYPHTVPRSVQVSPSTQQGVHGMDTPAAV